MIPPYPQHTSVLFANWHNNHTQLVSILILRSCGKSSIQLLLRAVSLLQIIARQYHTLFQGTATLHIGVVDGPLAASLILVCEAVLVLGGRPLRSFLLLLAGGHA